MKKSVYLLFMIISSLALAQSPKPEKVKYVIIKQKVCPNQKGFQLVLKAIATDSRCPEGVTCIWAGEVSAVILVYKDSKLIEEATLVFLMKNEEYNKKWFSNYLPEKQKKIKSIVVVPYPKEGSKINPEEYYMRIGYLK
ncbi:hypothetical protein [Flavobacterium glaciei]|uniref:Uncharacterized protein n=1 Tax=Flavobacterium glaciei TaxID=386300 RepID=A0A562PYI5_9FLAO|nr:hypothetical protein [Flavobacterium glaciei]RDI56576.1 hypothetical protein DFR66_104141 [Flavobacterium glaciei]TWI49146.1 hypothetical protein IQ02_01134 [Flavobacterium glaciei]